MTYSPDYEPGLKHDLLNIFNRSVGRRNAISREGLLLCLGWSEPREGFQDFERKVRAAILDLRLDGVLICSTGGVKGGYWLAESWDDLRDFTEREYHSRAMSMLETERVMKKAARERWGDEPAVQPSLFSMSAL